MNKIKAIIVFGFVTILFASCALCNSGYDSFVSSDDDGDTIAADQPSILKPQIEPDELTLENTTWMLKYIRKSNVLPGVMATAIFSKGEVSGSASCNHYFGYYRSKGKTSGTISLSALGMTEMYCMEPEGIMDQEMLFMETLGDAVRYEIKSGQLMIFHSDREALTFIPAN